MYIEIEEPKERISSDVVKVWRISQTVVHLFAFIIIGILLWCSYFFNWLEWLSLLLYFLAGVAVLSGLYAIIIEPLILYRTWRYKIDEDFVQLRYGRWNEKHILIPMEKVEYVRTEQGPLLRFYQLYNLEVGTTTSNHVIPGIMSEEAFRLKSQIATFAKVQDSAVMEGEHPL